MCKKKKKKKSIDAADGHFDESGLTAQNQSVTTSAVCLPPPYFSVIHWMQNTRWDSGVAQLYGSSKPLAVIGAYSPPPWRIIPRYQPSGKYMYMRRGFFGIFIGS